MTVQFKRRKKGKKLGAQEVDEADEAPAAGGGEQRPAAAGMWIQVKAAEAAGAVEAVAKLAPAGPKPSGGSDEGAAGTVVRAPEPAALEQSIAVGERREAQTGVVGVVEHQKKGQKKGKKAGKKGKRREESVVTLAAVGAGGSSAWD